MPEIELISRSEMREELSRLRKALTVDLIFYLLIALFLAVLCLKKPDKAKSVA